MLSRSFSLTTNYIELKIVILLALIVYMNHPFREESIAAIAHEQRYIQSQIVQEISKQNIYTVLQATLHDKRVWLYYNCNIILSMRIIPSA